MTTDTMILPRPTSTGIAPAERSVLLAGPAGLPPNHRVPLRLQQPGRCPGRRHRRSEHRGRNARYTDARAMSRPGTLVPAPGRRRPVDAVHTAVLHG